MLEKTLVDFITGPGSTRCEVSLVVDVHHFKFFHLRRILFDDVEQVYSLRMLFLDCLVEKAPLWVTLEFYFTQVLAEAVQFYIHNALQIIFLVLQLFLHLLNSFVNFLHDLGDHVLLSLDKEITIFLHDFILDLWIEGEPFDIFLAEHGVLVAFHLFGNILADIKEIACALIAPWSSKCLFHDLVFTHWKSFVII